MEQVMNVPLTEEELREMDGKLVWDPMLEEYATVDVQAYDGKGCVRYPSFYHPRLLIAGHFYRYKPR